MRHGRAQHFPDNVRSKFLEWDAYARDGYVHLELTVPGQGKVHAVMESADSYDMAHDVLTAFDRANGI
jgi:hypothetical protein